MTEPVRILGIDPGSRITGFGVIELTGNRLAYVDSGCIRIGDGAIDQRLRYLHEQMAMLMTQIAPDEMAIEQVFVSRNADSALKLGQARGVAICATALRDVPVAEYAATRIKQAVVGRGGAEKVQVQHMVAVILGLKGKLQADAADALAVAICHAHMRGNARQLAAYGTGRQA